VQIDAVAINWRTKSILLGEAKWQADLVGLPVIRELVEEKQPKVLSALAGDARDSNEKWVVYFTCFARNGFTTAAQSFAAEQGVQLVSLQQMDRDLTVTL
jgi:hypothetical protein